MTTPSHNTASHTLTYTLTPTLTHPHTHSGALYLLSFTTNQKYLDSKFRACVQFYLFSALVNFGQVHGLPKFNKEYLQKIMTDPAVQRLFGGVLLLTGSNFMALVCHIEHLNFFFFLNVHV